MSLRNLGNRLWRPMALNRQSLAAARFCTAGDADEDSSAADSGPVYDNKDVLLSFVSRGRLFKMKFQNQGEFQMFLEKANAVGATPTDEPNCMTSKLWELDPSKLHILVDSSIVMKLSKKILREKAEKGNCPTDFVKFINKDYETDDD